LWLFSDLPRLRPIHIQERFQAKTATDIVAQVVAKKSLDALQPKVTDTGITAAYHQWSDGGIDARIVYLPICGVGHRVKENKAVFAIDARWHS
jgi:hypothetical protein